MFILAAMTSLPSLAQSVFGTLLGTVSDGHDYGRCGSRENEWAGALAVIAFDSFPGMRSDSICFSQSFLETGSNV